MEDKGSILMSQIVFHRPLEDKGSILMSQIVFHRPSGRQRQHSNVTFRIRQTDSGCVWRACMLPPLSTSAQCGESIHLQQMRHHFFFFPISG